MSVLSVRLDRNITATPTDINLIPSESLFNKLSVLRMVCNGLSPFKITLLFNVAGEIKQNYESR